MNTPFRFFWFIWVFGQHSPLCLAAEMSEPLTEAQEATKKRHPMELSVRRIENLEMDPILAQMARDLISGLENQRELYQPHESFNLAEAFSSEASLRNAIYSAVQRSNPHELDILLSKILEGLALGQIPADVFNILTLSEILTVASTAKKNRVQIRSVLTLFVDKLGIDPERSTREVLLSSSLMPAFAKNFYLATFDDSDSLNQVLRAYKEKWQSPHPETVHIQKVWQDFLTQSSTYPHDFNQLGILKNFLIVKIQREALGEGFSADEFLVACQEFSAEYTEYLKSKSQKGICGPIHAHRDHPCGWELH